VAARRKGTGGGDICVHVTVGIGGLGGDARQWTASSGGRELKNCSGTASPVCAVCARAVTVFGQTLGKEGG